MTAITLSGLARASGGLLVVFADLLNPRILLAGGFKAAGRPGQRPGEAARNGALDVFLEEVKDGEPPGSRQKISL